MHFCWETPTPSSALRTSFEMYGKRMKSKSKRDLEQKVVRLRDEMLKENILRQVPLLKKQAASTFARRII